MVRRMLPSIWGDPLRLGHRNGTGIAEYDKQLKLLYGKYQLAAGNLIRLLHIQSRIRSTV